MTVSSRTECASHIVFVILGVILLLAGSYVGLFVAPAEQYMGNVQRIMYVHVPTAWNWMLAVTFTFVCGDRVPLQERL